MKNDSQPVKIFKLFMHVLQSSDITDTIQIVCPPVGEAMEVEAYATDPVYKM